jgi:hypothetical protein
MKIPQRNKGMRQTKGIIQNRREEGQQLFHPDPVPKKRPEMHPAFFSIFFDD